VTKPGNDPKRPSFRPTLGLFSKEDLFSTQEGRPDHYLIELLRQPHAKYTKAALFHVKSGVSR
jgi:hypothetical protein